MKIVTIIGARPQFIKAAIISRELKNYKNINEIIIHTGQHYDSNMSDIFFKQMGIPYPNYNLSIGGGTHGQMTGRQIEEIEKILILEKPHLVIVYGDTNSTLAGALAAVKLQIKIAHIEAGLRSFNRKMPEEINRIITDHISTILFAPTTSSFENLIREGIEKDKIHISGDIMYDASLFYKKVAQKPIDFENLNFNDYILCTIHRAENTDNEIILKNIFEGLSYSKIPIIIPIHPRTRARLTEFNILISNNIYLINPVGYLEMIWLEMNCNFIITDSGGVQKEAYFHKKKCLTLRLETEWVELLENNWNILVGSNVDKIKNLINNLKEEVDYKYLYGTGNSASEIVKKLL
jgi:UDP-GlcNAc3NAcA epimerase